MIARKTIIRMVCLTSVRSLLHYLKIRHRSLSPRTNLSQVKPRPPKKVEEPVVKQGLAQKREQLAQFQEKYLQPQRISHRKAVYVSEETLKNLDLVVRRIGERGATISGYVERVLREHLEQYKEDVEV